VLFYRGRQRILDADGAPVPGALANFYVSQTNNRQNTYQDAALTIAHQNPVPADDYGFLPPIYLDPSLTYKCIITDVDGASLPDGTIDPVLQSAFSQEAIGAALYPRTVAEIAAGVTPVDYIYPAGPVIDARRYGFVGDDATNNDAAIADVLNVLDELGGGILLVPAGFYRFAAGITVPNNVTIRGEGKGVTYFRATANITAITIPVNSDRVCLEEFSLVGNAKTGTGVRLGSTDYSSFDRLHRIGISGFGVGIRIAATLWTSIIECDIGSSTAGQGNTVGIDFNAGASLAAANQLTIERCFIGFNDRQGVMATSTPVNQIGLRVVGGSIEGNGSNDPANEPQFHAGNQLAFQIDGVYFEYAGGGTKPDAIRANGLGSGVIVACNFNGSTYGIRDSSGGDASTYVTIHNCQFTATTTECMRFPSDTGIIAFGNSEDTVSTITGTKSVHVTGKITDQSAEETAFTPTLIGSSTAGAQTYTVQAGRWNRQGNLIHIRGRVVITAKDGAMAGSLQVGGLPVAAINQADCSAVIAITTTAVTNAVGYTQFVGRILPNSTVISIIELGSNVGSSLVPVSQAGASTAIEFCGTYAT
jgi:hypothetical protein